MLAPLGFTFVVLTTFIITFHIYLCTCSHSVSGGDSGEVMVAAHDLAVAHPPGYPLFVMIYNLIGKQFLFDMKMGNVLLSLYYHRHPDQDNTMEVVSLEQDKRTLQLLPFYFNVVSCFLSAIGASFITAAAFIWTKGDIAASMATSFIIFLSPSIWTYALQTEVFALHNFFVALLLFLLVWYDSRPSVFRACVGAFFCGLSLTNQHTSVLMVVPLAASIALYRQLGSLKSRPIAVTVLYTFCFVLGLSPYYFLVFSSQRSDNYEDSSTSLIAWGNTSSWDGFIHHFLRADYGTLSLGSKESTYLVRGYHQSLRAWKLFMIDSFEQLGSGMWVVIPILGMLAVVMELKNKRTNTNNNKHPKEAALNKKNKQNSRSMDKQKEETQNQENESEKSSTPLSSSKMFVPTVVLLCWIIYTIFFHTLSNLPIDQPLFLGVQQRFWMHPFMLIAFFSAPGLSFLKKKLFSSRGASSVLLLLWNVLVPCIILIVQLLLNFDSHNEKNNFYVENFGKAILDSLPENSILLTKGDLVVNSVRFLQGIKKYRTDVAVLDQEMLTYPWYVNRAAKLGIASFPGRYYYPGKRDTFDMRMFLKANQEQLSNSRDHPHHQRRRRAYFCYGVKEGDYSIGSQHDPAATIDLRVAGICEEAVKKKNKKHSLHDPLTINKQKDASLWALELMRSLPFYGRDVVVPDSTLLSSSSSSSTFSLFNQLKEIFLQLISSGRIVKQRSVLYKKTEWENVTSSDLSAAFERVAFTLNRIAEGQKTKHPELLMSSSSSDESTKTNTVAVFPPESWTLEDMERVCEPCTRRSEASMFAYDQIKHFNRRPTLPCASDTRTVLMCGIFTADKLLEEMIRRFPQDVTSNVYRNQASFVQNMMHFLAPQANKKTNRDLLGKIIKNLDDFVDAAKKEMTNGNNNDNSSIDQTQIQQMKAAADYYRRQL